MSFILNPFTGKFDFVGTGGAGTVTGVSFTGGIISVANPTTAPALTVAGVSGGIPYFSGAATWTSSASLVLNSLMVGGGVGGAPATVTTGTGILAALGVNVGSAGAPVLFNGALGTPLSGVLTNCTGLPNASVTGLGTMALQAASAISVTGGTVGGLTSFGVRSTGAAFDLKIASAEVLAANRNLSFNVGDADRVLTIPSTGTAALLGTANVFTLNNEFRLAIQTHLGNNEGVIIGNNAGGTYAANASDQIAIGFFAGAGSATVGSAQAVRIGRHAGYAAIGDQGVCLGHAAGQYAYDSASSVIVGYLSGRNQNQITGFHAFDSVIIGHEAATDSVSAQTGVFLGSQCGKAATNAVGAVMAGYGAGTNATNAGYSVIIGYNAGNGSTNAVNSVLLGNRAGYSLSRNNSLVIESNATYSDAGNTGLIYGEFDTRLLTFNASTTNLAPLTAGIVNIGGGATASELHFLEPSASGTNYTGFKAQAQVTNVVYTLPAADGSSNQVLSTNGSAVLSWSTVAAGASLGTNTFTAVQNITFGIAAATKTNGLSMTNSTAATSGNQTYSPSLVLTGNQFASGASRTCSWTVTNIPVEQNFDHAILQFSTIHGANAAVNILNLRSYNNGTFLETGVSGAAMTIGSTAGSGALNFQCNAIVYADVTPALLRCISGTAFQLGNAAITGLTPAISAGLLTKSVTVKDSTGATITLYGS